MAVVPTMSKHFNIRPFANPWKLAGRIAFIALLSVVISNVLYWTSMYFRLFGSSCGQELCPNSFYELVLSIALSTGIWMCLIVPVATLILTPFIYVGSHALTPVMGGKLAVLVASSVSVFAFIFIPFFLIYSLHDGVVTKSDFQNFGLDGRWKVTLSVVGISLVIATGVFILKRVWKG